MFWLFDYSKDMTLVAAPYVEYFGKHSVLDLGFEGVNSECAD